MLSSDIFARAFETARAGLLLLEKNTGRVIESNAAFLQMCGRAREDVVGRVFWQTPLIGDAEAGAEIFEHLRAGHSVESAELPLETRDGARLLLAVCGHDLGGGVVQLEVEDATARESARLVERMDAQRQLAQRAAVEFTGAQQALQSAQEMLANCARRGQSTFLESDEIRKAADRAAGIARELLSYGEQLVLEPAQLDLNEMMESMGLELQRLLGPKIHLVLALNPDTTPVMADRAQIRQILLKLAANTREAMAHAGTFRIETANAPVDDPALRHASGAAGYTMLAVSDNGPGMDDESWAHLYQPFFSTKNGKRGLGLAAVHGIVRQSGGRLWADSVPSQGTSFRFYLPQAVSQPALTPAPLPAKPAIPAILVAEPNDGVRSVVTSILKKRGYRVLALQEAQRIAGTENVRTLSLNGLTKPFELETLLEKVRELVAQ
jgi:two-component system cell cycle sensor histidine kinase/response regulator CckA